MLLCQTCVFITTMVATALFIITLFIISPSMLSADLPCPDGRFCPDAWVCCDHGCCAATTLTPKRLLNETHKEHTFEYPWYGTWPALFLAWTLFGILISVCCIWCFSYTSGTRQCSCTFACCVPRSTSDLNSTGSSYPPPQYSRCGSFLQAPPPYSEVTSKPDLYPLVIPSGEGENKNNGNYLMVHYFRNYMFRPPGSISATSTAESLNSSFICNATNETNSIIPPPYSCASNYEEWRGSGDSDRDGGPVLRSFSSLTEPTTPPPPLPRTRTAPPMPSSRRITQDMSPDDAFRDTLINSPVQPTVNCPYDLDLELIDYELSCDSGCRPRLGQSPPIQHSSPSADNVNDNLERDLEKIRHFYRYPSPDTACESPPQPTSPTQTSRDSTLRRTSEERRHRRLESVKKYSKLRKSSLYMPLSTNSNRTSRISPGSRISSRSAPVTPCNPIVPNLLAFSQRLTGSRHGSKSSKLGGEESNPLIFPDEDHKF